MADRSTTHTVSARTLAARGYSLAEIYYRHFDVVRCDTPELVREAQKLRYQVYCVETGFEDPLENPGGLETDEADAHALHSLLVHKPSGAIAGTVRLILPDPDKTHRGLPAIGLSPVLQAASYGSLPILQTAEISRFSISKQFRRRAGDGLYPAASSPDVLNINDPRVIPSITFGLMRAVVAMTREAGMTHLVAVVEPPLIRLLARFGIRFERTGERVDYHGVRHPLHRDMTELLREIYERDFDVWQTVTDDGALWPLGGLEERCLA